MLKLSRHALIFSLTALSALAQTGNVDGDE